MVGVEAPAIVSGLAKDMVKVSSGEFKARNQPNLLSFGKISSSASSRGGQKKRTGSAHNPFKKSQVEQKGGSVYVGGQLTKQNLLRLQALQKKTDKQKKQEIMGTLETSIDPCNDRIQESLGMFAPNFSAPKQDGSLSKINQASSGRHANKNKTSRQLSSDFKNFNRSHADKQIIIPKNSRSRCGMDLEQSVGHRKLASNLTEQVHFGTQNIAIKSSTNVSSKQDEVQQMPLTLQTLSLLQQPVKNYINLLVEPENDSNLQLQFRTENKRPVSAVSRYQRKRKQMMSEIPSQTLLYPRKQLGPSASTLSKEAELIQGRRIQNQSKLVVSSEVNDFDVDPLMVSLQYPKKHQKSHQNAQHQHSQQMCLLRRSEKLIKQGQQGHDAMTSSYSIYNLDDAENIDVNASWGNQKVLNFASKTNYGPTKQSISPSNFDISAQFLPSEVVNRQKNTRKKQNKSKNREGFNSSMGLRSVDKTAAQSKIMMTSAAQQRKFLNGIGDKDKKYSTNEIFRSKSGTGGKPPNGKKKRPLNNQTMKGDQFQEYLEGNLIQNSTSSGLKVTNNKKGKAPLASTTLNILTASNKIVLQTSDSPQIQQGVVAKKQQNMLLKESNKAAKKTKIGRRSKAQSQISFSTKQSADQGQSRRRSSATRNNEIVSDFKRKNKSQSPRSHKFLAQTAALHHNRKSISHSSHSKSRHNSSNLKSHPLHSSGSRHNFSSKGSSQVKRKSLGYSQERRSSYNRRTVECLIANQLRDQPDNRLTSSQNMGNSSIEMELVGNESQSTLAPFLKNVLDLFSGEGSQCTANSVEKEQALKQVMKDLKSKKQYQISNVLQLEMDKREKENLQQRHGKKDMTHDKNSFSLHHIVSSKERSESKLDKIIKQNLRRHKAQINELRNRHAIKLEQQKEKKANIQLENQRVRKENRDIVMRKKSKENTKGVSVLPPDYNEFQTSQKAFLRKSVDSQAELSKLEKNIQRMPFQRPRSTFKILSGPEDEQKDENERSNSQRRQTCGLDFIDVRREIAADLRKDEVMGEKVKLLKTSLSQRNVRKKDRLGTTSASGLLKKLKNANGSAALNFLTQKFTNKLANRTQKHKVPNITQLQEQSPVQQQQSQGLQMQTTGKVTPLESGPIHLKKEQIRKFIKDKKKKDKKVLKREQAQEIKTILQVKENLLKLNRFVAVANINKQMQNTGLLREADKTLIQKQTGIKLQRPVKKDKHVGMIHNKISKQQIKIVDSNMGTLTPSNKLPFEKSEKSFRINAQNADQASTIGSREGLRRSDYVQNYSELYEDSVMKQNESAGPEQNKRTTGSDGIDSNYNPLRRMLQPNFQVSEGSNQIKASKFKRRKAHQSTHASYFEHSSRDSSSNSRQAALLRLKYSRSPQISRKSTSHSPSQQDKQKSQTQQIKKVTVKPKAKKATPSIKVKQQQKSSHLRYRSTESQPRSSISSNRDIQKPQHYVQPKSTTLKVTKKIQIVQQQQKQKIVRQPQLTQEQAATKIQHAVKENLYKTGFYQEQQNKTSSQYTGANSLSSPEMKQLIDLHIEQESDGTFNPDDLNMQIIVEMNKDKKKELQLPQKFKKPTKETAAPHTQTIEKPQERNPNLLTVEESSNDPKEVEILDQVDLIAIRQGGANKPSIQAQLKAMMQNASDDDSSKDLQSLPSNAKSSDCIDDINRRGATWLNKNNKQGQHKSAQELERVDEMMQKPPPLLLVHEEQEQHTINGDSKIPLEVRAPDAQGQFAKKSNQMLHVEGLSPQTHSDKCNDLMGMLHQPSQISIESKDNSSQLTNKQHVKEAKSSSESKSQKSSKTSSSLFPRQNLVNLMHDNEYQQLIKFREDWLVFKEKKENRAIQKLLKSNQCSPRSYQEKKNQIDKWVDIQKQDLQQTKLVFQQEWDKTVQMIEETQKNVDQMKEKVGGPQQLKVDSKSSQSVLIEDPPKSYRSGQQSLISGSQGLSNLMGKKSGIFEDPEDENDSLMKKMNKIPLGALESEDGEKSSQHMQHETSQELLERLEREFSKNIAKSNEDISEQDLEKLLSNKLKDEAWSPAQIQHKESNEILLEQVLRDFNDEPLSSEKNKSQVVGIDQPTENFRDSVMVTNEDIGFEKSVSQDTDSPSVVKVLKPSENNSATKQEEAENIGPNKDLAVPEFSEPSIESSPNKQKKEDENQQAELTEKSFDNEPAITSGQTTTFETQADPYCINMGRQAQVAEPEIADDSSEKSVELRLNLYSNEDYKDVEELFAKHTALAKKEELVDHITETLLQNVLKDIHMNFPPERAQEKKKVKVVAKNHESASEVYVVDLTYGQKQERREWIEAHHRHLIERELYQSDTYIGEALERLLMYEIDSSDESDEYSPRSKKSKLEPQNQFCKESPLNLHIQFLKALTQPIVRSQQQLLESLTGADGPSYAHFETSFEVQKFPIIPVDLYLEVERIRDEEEQYDRSRLKEQLNSSAELSVVVESVHIQNKCYFDALNESLMKFRPYGITGEPMPWSTKIRRLQTKVDINSVDTERLFQMVKHDLFRWASAFCGTLPTSDFLLPISGKNRKAEAKFNEELFQETRDKRLSQVLHSETVEQEHHWLNFEFEESKVKLDVADAVLDHLILEMAGFLNEKVGMKAEHKSLLPPVKDQMPEKQPSKLDALFGDLQKYTGSGDNIVGDPLLMCKQKKTLSNF